MKLVPAVGGNSENFCRLWSGAAAAYRLLDNERCGWRQIIATHKSLHSSAWLIGKKGVTLAARAERRARVVRQKVRLRRVALRPGDAPTVPAGEIEAGASKKPVYWRLLSNRGPAVVEQAKGLIEWYCASRGNREVLEHVEVAGEPVRNRAGIGTVHGALN